MVIRSTAKGKEHTISGHKVDGYCEETQEIFEFHGCFYHGCTKCCLHNKPIYNQDKISLNLLLQ